VEGQRRAFNPPAVSSLFLFALSIV
jgi:hypothetical protein